MINSVGAECQSALLNDLEHPSHARQAQPAPEPGLITPVPQPDPRIGDLSTRTRKRRRVSADPIAPDDVLARYVEHNGSHVPARAPSTRVTSLTYDGTPPANFAAPARVQQIARSRTAWTDEFPASDRSITA